jgi:hypothetical protein
MKKIVIIVLGCLLMLSPSFAGEPTAADQKWLAAVEKIVSKGETRISTPSKDRVSLLKEWAGKNGYSVQVTESDGGYHLELSKHLAKQ